MTDSELITRVKATFDFLPRTFPKQAYLTVRASLDSDIAELYTRGYEVCEEIGSRRSITITRADDDTFTPL